LVLDLIFDSIMRLVSSVGESAVTVASVSTAVVSLVVSVAAVSVAVSVVASSALDSIEFTS
jgi:hypothetical protein